MAYAQYSVTSLDEVIVAAAAFAGLQGMDVTTSGATRTFAFNVNDDTKYVMSGAANILLISRAGAGANDNAASWRQGNPLITSNTYMQPTKVHMMYYDEPLKYLAGVIEYGYNLYRHFYIGNLEKLGDFGGGEVFGGAGANFGSIGNSGTTSSDLITAARPMFSSRASHGAQYCGGVRVVHPDSGAEWKMFNQGTLNPNATSLTLPKSRAYGGFFDVLNDGYYVRGLMGLSGEAVLTAQTLYQGDDGQHFIPLGHPTGLRAVRMDNLLAEARVTVGNETWIVFPMLSRHASDISPIVGQRLLGLNERSGYYGYAYLIEVAT